MRAWLDCGTGVSGDKFLGALVDAGFSLEALRETLGGLGVAGLSAEEERVSRGGIAGVAVRVIAPGAQPERPWRDVRALLEAAALDADVRDGALRTFALLAEAEARVHGVQVDDVHFHEVGACDSIADIVGVAAGLAALGIDDLAASPVAVGSGTVETAHGTLPVPAPATAELLAGVPSFGGDVPGELTTPTGAALLRTFATSFGPMPPMTPARVGYGAGARELPVPNVLRLVLGEAAPLAAGPGTAEEVAVLDTNLDHVTPEHLAYACERLLDAGALDVWRVPIVMKKGRSGVALSVMTEPGDAARFSAMMMELTGALGVRRRLSARDVVPRRVETVDTAFGPVRVKIAGIGGRERVRPEHDDVAAIAKREGLPYDVVARRVTASAEEALGC